MNDATKWAKEYMESIRIRKGERAMTEWEQERPLWCPHHDCVFRRRTMDDACAGGLPEPLPHGSGFNDYRLCFNGVLPKGEIFDLQVNDTDLQWLRWLFDWLDGKCTSWLSKSPPQDHDE